MGWAGAQRTPELDEAAQKSETILSTADYRVVTKISSCWVNTTSRRGIKQLGIFLVLFFFCFSIKVPVRNPRPPALSDSPADYFIFTD